MLIYHDANPRALKNYAKPPLPMPCKWDNKAWMIPHLSTTWFIEYFKPNVRLTALEKKKKKDYSETNQSNEEESLWKILKEKYFGQREQQK